MNIKVLKTAAIVLLIIQVILLIVVAIFGCELCKMMDGLEWQGWIYRAPQPEVIHFFLGIGLIFHAIGIYGVTKENSKIIAGVSVLFIISILIIYCMMTPANIEHQLCFGNPSGTRTICSLITRVYNLMFALNVSHVVLVLVLWAYFIQLRNVETTRNRGGVVHQQQVCVAQPAPVAGMVHQQQGVPVYHSAGIAYQQQGVSNFPPPYPTQNIRV